MASSFAAESTANTSGAAVDTGINWAVHAQDIELQKMHVEDELHDTVAKLRPCEAALDRRNKRFMKLLTTLKVTRNQLKSAKDDAKLSIGALGRPTRCLPLRKQWTR